MHVMFISVFDDWIEAEAPGKSGSHFDSVVMSEDQHRFTIRFARWRLEIYWWWLITGWKGIPTMAAVCLRQLVLEVLQASCCYTAVLEWRHRSDPNCQSPNHFLHQFDFHHLNRFMRDQKAFFFRLKLYRHGPAASNAMASIDANDIANRKDQRYSSSSWKCFLTLRSLDCLKPQACLSCKELPQGFSVRHGSSCKRPHHCSPFLFKMWDAMG